MRLSLLGCVGLVAALSALAGCQRQGWFVEREPWRKQAEEDCLKSGVVREGPGIAMLKPIAGPGMCGADFPLKVAALGETSSRLGYADELPLRPPGSVQQVAPRNSPFSVNPDYPADTRLPVRGIAPAARDGGYTPYSPAAPEGYAPRAPYRGQNGPVSLTPPGVDGPQEDDAAAEDGPSYEPPRSRPSYMPPLRGRTETVPLRSTPPQLTVTPAQVTPAATLACPVVSALDRWVLDAIQPAAQKWFGVPVTEIKQISAYSCRGMNGNPGAHISEHAFGNALDVAGFVLADGRKVMVKSGWRGAPEEQGFLRDVQAAACDIFNTVLAPGSNVYHYDHIHVDLMRRNSGRRICQPGAVSGDEVAARAGGRPYAGRKGDGSVTGSIAPHRMARPPSRLSRNGADAYADEEEAGRGLPFATPGED